MNDFARVHDKPWEKHWVRPVAPFSAVPVHLLAGTDRHLIDAERPRRFDELTLISRETCSKRTSDMAGQGPRAVSKRLLSRYARPVRTGYFFDTRFIEPNNISHLLMDIIPLCLAAREQVDDVTFVFRPLQPRFRELLAWFGIEPLCTYRPVSGRRLTFRLSRGLSQFEISETFDAPLYSYTGDVYAGHGGRSEPGSRVFVSRRGARAPSNAAELDAFVQGRGFRIVYLEDHTIAEQIAIMQRADEVIAIHGAAIAFLALKERSKALIEIMPPNVYHDHFAVGVGNKVGTFVQIIPSFDEAVQFEGWSAIHAFKQQPFTVDLGQLEQALDLVR